jgi:hypothetical protein
MKGETYLYFSDGLTGTANDTGAFKSSDFLGAEIAGASSVVLKFKAGEKYNTKAAVITLNCSAQLGSNNSLKFNNVCRTISGLLNSSNNMVSVADDANGIYVYPFKPSTDVDDVA